MLFDRTKAASNHFLLSFCIAVLGQFLLLSIATTEARSSELLLRQKTQLKGSFWGVTETDGAVVAVGLKGQIGHSSDHTNWLTTAPQKGTHLLGAATAAAGLIFVGGKGFTSGKGILLKAGPRLETVTEITQTNAPLYEVGFYNAAVGHAVGARGVVVRTEDGGKTWSALSSDTMENLWALKFISPSTGMIGGGATPWQNQNMSSGIILRTTDAGQTWTKVYDGKHRISDFSFVNAQQAYASGVGGVLLKSGNGGKSWHAVGNTPLKTIVNALVFQDEKCGVIVGAGGTAYLTRDGGLTWPGKIVVTKGSFLEALAPSRRTSGAYWVVAGNGTIGLIDLAAYCRR